MALHLPGRVRCHGPRGRTTLHRPRRRPRGCPSPRDLPVLAVAQDMSKQYGIMRQRMVPRPSQALFGPDKFTDELLEKMEWFEVNAGEPFHEKIALTTEETLAMEGRSITYQPSRGMGNPNERAGRDGTASLP